MRVTIQNYLEEITSALKRGNATEHTHRPAPQTLLQTLGSGFVATNERNALSDLPPICRGRS